MAILTLKEILERDGNLTADIDSQLKIKTKLINDLELCGFVNSCDILNMWRIASYNQQVLAVNGFIDKNFNHNIICSGYLKQILEIPGAKDQKLSSFNIVSQIFTSLSLSKEDTTFNLVDMYIPSLRGNALYKKIKEKKHDESTIAESNFSKYDFPDNIKKIDNRIKIEVQAGSILCLDKFGCVKSVGENIMAICRYLHESTGVLHYAIFELDEIYTENND